MCVPVCRVGVVSHARLHVSLPFISNRPFAHCIDYLTDYCVAKYIAPVVVSVCDTVTLHARGMGRTITPCGVCTKHSA